MRIKSAINFVGICHSSAYIVPDVLLSYRIHCVGCSQNEFHKNLQLAIKFARQKKNTTNFEMEFLAFAAYTGDYSQWLRLNITLGYVAWHSEREGKQTSVRERMFNILFVLSSFGTQWRKRKWTFQRRARASSENEWICYINCRIITWGGHWR